MILTEIIVFGITLGTIIYVHKIIVRILTDESFDIHLFNDLAFKRKIQWEQENIINNLMYIFSILLLGIIHIFISFDRYEWYTWFHLYAFIQVYIIIIYHRLSTVDKTVAFSALILYYMIPSTHMNNLIVYTTLNLEPFVYMDKQLFGEKAYLKKYHKKMLKIDSVFLFIFWPLSILSFYFDPCFVDIVFIPISFYYQLFQTKLNNKKKV